MNCYDCTHRRSVPGSAHSACAHEVAKIVKPLIFAKAAMGYMSQEPIPVRFDHIDRPIVLLNLIGIRHGWALWPIDFDPCWIEQCLLFNAKPVYHGEATMEMPGLESESLWMSDAIIDENTEG